MKYMGSKARHAKEMLPIILKDRKPGQLYVEPFVGGANMIDKVSGNRLGADIHEYLIAMWKEASKGWIPPEHITEAEYRDMMKNKTSYPAHLVGYVGFSMSYGGRWFEGWRRDSQGKRNYAAESFRGAVKQFPLIKDVSFVHTSYDKLKIPEISIIYCDPPYKGTKQYKDKLDYEKFYGWCRAKRQEGHTIFISEYEMPEDFVCVWSKEVTNSLTKDTGAKKGIEKLFTLY